ncbi:hypothetical protein D3C72_2023130 [compost metagenome]
MRARRPFVAPLQQSHQHGKQFLALGREPVALPLLLSFQRRLFQYAQLGQPVEPASEDVAGDAQPLLEFIEARRAQHAFAHDEQAPPLAHLVERAGY